MINELMQFEPTEKHLTSHAVFLGKDDKTNLFLVCEYSLWSGVEINPKEYTLLKTAMQDFTSRLRQDVEYKW